MKDNALENDELIISRVLQIGVMASAAFILFGLCLFLLRHTSRISPMGGSPYRQYVELGYNFPHSLPALWSTLKRGNSLGFITLGALLMILTPIARVAVTIILFIHKHDKPMTAVTVFVLAVLVGSFVFGVFVR